MSGELEVAAPEQVEEQIVSEIQDESIEEVVQDEVIEVEAESESELQDEIEEAIEEGATEEEVQSMVKSYQLKVNGKEFIKELDLGDEEAVQKELQMAAAGRSAMQEAAELKKAYEQELVRLKQNPMEYLEALGLDPMELSVDRINRQIELDKKSPEEVATDKMQIELKEAREKAESLEKKMQDQEDSRLYEQESAKLKDEIQVALDAHTSLHASPRITRRVAETMEWAMNNGFDDVTAADVLPTVEAQLLEEMQEMFTDLDEKSIERYIGKGNMDRMRQKKVAAQAKKPTGIAALKKESSRAAVKEEAPRKKQSLNDFMRRR